MELLGREVDLEDGQVRVGVAADYLGLHLRVVSEEDGHRGGVLHHVVVGHDVPLGVPDEAGSGAPAEVWGLPELGGKGAIDVLGHADVDDGGEGPLVEVCQHLLVGRDDVSQR